MIDTKQRVLVVDDEPINLQLLRQILQEHYQLTFATDGTKAMELAQKHGTDLILLDVVMMPEMDGFEVCRQLKASPETAEIPVIFLTAKTQTDDIVRGFNVGAVDYVTKPFNKEELLVRVSTHLRLRHTEEALRNALSEAQTARESAELALQRNLRMQMRIDQDLTAGAAMQRKFLTGCEKADELLSVPGFKLIVYNRPYAGVSGDFFYPKMMTDQCAGLFFADTCGHGLPAALISMRMLGLLQSLPVSDCSPQSYLWAVNQDICDVMPPGRFIAASYLIFHPGRVGICNAGQPFPILISEGKAREIPLSGTPIGVLYTPRFSEAWIKMNMGDLLLLCSDGITEARNDHGECLGKERLLRLLEDHAFLKSDEMRAKIVDMLNDFKGQAPPDDDMTLLIIERKS